MKIVTGYTGKPHVTSDDAASLNRGIFGNGKDYILAAVKNQCAASIGSDGKTITIAEGDVVIDGVHARITAAETVTISNGTQGKYRNDLIVARYTKNASTAVENVSLVLITGTAGTTAVDPSHNTGIIANGALIRDAVLYRVSLYGNNIQSITQVTPYYYAVDIDNIMSLVIKGPLDVKGPIHGTSLEVDGSNHSATFTAEVGNESVGNVTRIASKNSNGDNEVDLCLLGSGALLFNKGAKYIVLPLVQHGYVGQHWSAQTPLPVTHIATNVTFPTAYATVPDVIVSIQGYNPKGLNIAVSNITTTGCTIYTYRDESCEVEDWNVTWAAFGEQI